ncbi:glycosyltransferase [Ammoniphilus sp. CFH 90114]|uniref:glycosyltransferase n=1 Tax=Ammoniphilus sp. CFH 90114 TaxID=2493665 RepID=UPI00100DD690|nr:glycosyltransferase [Ammoniphilus sp. CFH 90114]RXT04509.1 glycosyltransferase [Ammoniphilus sp. CFH 90114]
MNYKQWQKINKSKKKINIIKYFKNWHISYILFKSGFFNSSYYVKEYPEVLIGLRSGFFYRLSVSSNRILQLIGKVMVHPIRHYVWNGVYEGKKPSRSFDTVFYIENNHDVAHSGVNPLFHYIKHGAIEGRQPLPKLKDLALDSIPIKMQIKTIKNSGLFDEAYYLENNLDVANAKMDPVEHYCYFGWRESRNPSDIFNTKFYLSNNEDVLEAGINPLYHYILLGMEEGRRPFENETLLPCKRDITILFIGHEAEQTGAPIILLDIIKWFNKFTSYKVKVILLRGGQIQEEYKKSAETLVLNEQVNKNTFKATISDFIGDDNCIIFLNTVVSARFIELMDLSKYPSIAFIHELEKTLRIFPKETNLLKKNIRSLIAASDAVTDNLIYNHGYREEEVETVFAFIDPQHQFLDDNKRKERRKKLNLPADKLIIFGCGVLYWRKNPKGFIEIAEKVLTKTDKECEFIWIGDGEEKDICERLIKKKNLENHIKFIGSVDNPRDYFAAGDIFLLPAVEDPFPLVCLEAADSGLPIICYDEAGGMPRFVEDDAGIVVPFNDINKMAGATCILIEDKVLREKLGRTAREKVLERHVINKSAMQIKKIIDDKLGVKPFVSVVVPNYNHSKYLQQRLDSIYNQSYRDLEIILLDDVSTDNSREILDSYADRYPEITRKLYNKENSGSVFLQWLRGIEAARGDVVWVAESDDYCEQNFIEMLLPPFKDTDAVLSYSNSNIVGPSGQFYNTYDNVPWLTDVDELKWKNNYYNKGAEEFLEALSIKCTIPNVSSVLFRREPALEAIKYTFNYKKAGDWIFYAHLSRFGNIAYCSSPLNYHRRHEGSVTSRESDDKGVEEIYLIHKHFVNNFHVPDMVRHSMISFIENEYNIYNMRKSVSKSLSELYDKQQILDHSRKPKVALYQHGLNFGKGGAEKMLIEIANQLFFKGYNVSIYNRTYSDAPLPYKLNPNIPIYNIALKDDLGSVLQENKPDICLVNSIGHSDVLSIDQIHSFDIPVILTMHNQPGFFDQSPGKKDHTLSLQKSDCVVTLIPSFKEEYLKRGVSTQIEVIPNFVLKPRVYGKFKGLNNRKFIFTAGRLVEQKQQSILIDAFAKISTDFPSWDLLIAGEGHLRPFLEQQINHLGLNNRVVLLGEVDNIGDYYKNCDLFVLPSKFEGFSLVILEIASFGKPVILFKDCPPYGEIINDEDGIVLVSEMTSNALSNALRENMNQNQQNIEEAMYKFYSQYSPDTLIPMWEELINKYTSVIKR